MTTNKKYIIDFTACTMPEWWGKDWPLIIEARTGKFMKEYDMLTSKVSRRVYREMCDSIRNRQPNALFIKEAPIGFDPKTLPKGAVIREVKP